MKFVNGFVGVFNSEPLGSLVACLILVAVSGVASFCFVSAAVDYFAKKELGVMKNGRL